MAYGEKYNLTFTDLRVSNPLTWQILILQDGYGGASTSLKATGNPITLSWKGEGILTPMRGSECTLNIQSQSNFQYSEFFDVSELEYIVQVKKSGSLWWEGALIVENYSEPYTDTPYNIRLRFSCGLGNLKFIKYEGDLGPFVGKSPIILIITACLNKLPYIKQVIEVINVMEDDIPDIVTNGFLNTTYLDNLVFIEKSKSLEETDIETWSCYDVLKEIMIAIGCTMFQSANNWYIVRIEELEKTNPAYIKYVAGFGVVDSTGTIDIRKDITNTEVGITFLESNANMRISEVFDKLIYNYNYTVRQRNADQLIRDFDMTMYFNASDPFQLWEQSAAWIAGVAEPGLFEKSDWYQQNTSDLDFSVVMTIGRQGIMENTNTFNADYYIIPLDYVGATKTHEGLLTTVDDQATLSLDGAFLVRLFYNRTTAIPSWENIIYNIDFYFQIKVGDYYLQQDSDGILSWDTPENNIFYRLSQKLGGAFDKWPLHDSDTGNLIQRYFFLFNFEIELPVFPETGLKDLTIKFYSPVNPLLESVSHIGGYVRLEWISINTFSFEFNPLNNKLLNFKKTEQIAEGVREKEKEIIVQFGDGPHQTLRHAFKVKPGSDYLITDNWYKRGNIVNLFSAAEVFILAPFGKYLGAYRREITAILYGDFDFFNVIKSKYNKLYIQNTLTFNIKQVSYEVNLLEIKDIELVFTTETTVGLIDKLPRKDDMSTVSAYTELEGVTGLIANSDNIASENNALVVRATPIININDGFTSVPSYKNYPTS